MKKLILIITCLLLISCSTPLLGVRKDYSISVEGDSVNAIIYPMNVSEAYEYMKNLRRHGYECNEQNTACEGENVYIYRVFDIKGQIYLIVKQK